MLARVGKIVVFMLGVICISVMRREFGWTAVMIMTAYGFLTALWFAFDEAVHRKGD